MQITSKNFPDMFLPVFYKATQSGVQMCFIVHAPTTVATYTEKALDWGPIVEPVSGYITDSLFTKIRYGGINHVPVIADLWHFDQPMQAFFTTEQEATEYHRELVINYIKGLNASSLKTCPIEV